LTSAGLRKLQLHGNEAGTLARVAEREGPNAAER